MIQKPQTQIIQRTFVLENQTTLQTDIIKTKINVHNNYADLKPVIQTVSKNFFKISFFNNQSAKYVEIKFDQEGYFKVPKIFLEIQFIMIRYGKPRNKNNYISQDQSSSSISSSDGPSLNKKQRSRQRTIEEVLSLVKKWRQLHTASTKEGKKKLSLQSAASLLGVSKKTLDDYYYQLRIGQLEGFNFQQNLHQKIGFLRSFIKSYSNNRHKKNYTKHPKRLQAIQEHTQSIGKTLPEMELQQDNNQQEPNQIQMMDIEDLLNLSNSDADRSLEDLYFGEFNYDIRKNQDPFFNFKKKQYSQQPF